MIQKTKKAALTYYILTGWRGFLYNLKINLYRRKNIVVG